MWTIKEQNFSQKCWHTLVYYDIPLYLSLKVNDIPQVKQRPTQLYIFNNMAADDPATIAARASETMLLS